MEHTDNGDTLVEYVVNRVREERTSDDLPGTPPQLWWLRNLQGDGVRKSGSTNLRSSYVRVHATRAPCLAHHWYLFLNLRRRQRVSGQSPRNASLAGASDHACSCPWWSGRLSSIVFTLVVAILGQVRMRMWFRKSWRVLKSGLIASKRRRITPLSRVKSRRSVSESQPRLCPTAADGWATRPSGRTILPVKHVLWGPPT